MPDEPAIVEGHRFQLPSGAIAIVGLLEFGGMAAAVFLLGMDLWIPVQCALIVGAMLLREVNGALTLITMNVVLGMDFSVFFFGFPTWPSGLVGIIAILIVGTHFFTKQGMSTTGGDQNPILYILLIIATRAWAALYYATNTAFTEFNDNTLTWISVFVFGALPDLPLLGNILLVAFMNGTLLLYLVLLLKRIANPLAN